MTKMAFLTLSNQAFVKFLILSIGLSAKIVDYC